MGNSNVKLIGAMVWSFIALYLCTASISFYHCIEFCNIGNPIFLSVVMSFAFEVGLALVLFSILVVDTTKDGDEEDESGGNFMSWVLMVLLTGVQVMGNIYSVEKYMELSNNNFYIYLQNGFLHWFTEDMPEKDIMSIVAMLLGALLPIVTLLMTHTVSKYWKRYQKLKNNDNTTSKLSILPFSAQSTTENLPTEDVEEREETAKTIDTASQDTEKEEDGYGFIEEYFGNDDNSRRNIEDFKSPNSLDGIDPISVAEAFDNPIDEVAEKSFEEYEEPIVKPDPNFIQEDEESGEEVAKENVEEVTETPSAEEVVEETMEETEKTEEADFTELDETDDNENENGFVYGQGIPSTETETEAPKANPKLTNAIEKARQLAQKKNKASVAPPINLFVPNRG